MKFFIASSSPSDVLSALHILLVEGTMKMYLDHTLSIFRVFVHVNFSEAALGFLLLTDHVSTHYSGTVAGTV